MISGHIQQRYHQLPSQYSSYTKEDISMKSNDWTEDFDSNYIHLFEHHIPIKFQVPVFYEQVPISDLVCVQIQWEVCNHAWCKMINIPASQKEHFVNTMYTHGNRRGWISHVRPKSSTKQQRGDCLYTCSNSCMTTISWLANSIAHLASLHHYCCQLPEQTFK